VIFFKSDARPNKRKCRIPFAEHNIPQRPGRLHVEYNRKYIHDCRDYSGHLNTLSVSFYYRKRCHRITNTIQAAAVPSVVFYGHHTRRLHYRLSRLASPHSISSLLQHLQIITTMNPVTQDVSTTPPSPIKAPRKRKRIVISCTECHRRKQKVSQPLRSLRFYHMVADWTAKILPLHLQVASKCICIH
jgi:hypothetical protein